MKKSRRPYCPGLVESGLQLKQKVPTGSAIPEMRFIYVTVPQRRESLARFSPPGFRSGYPHPRVAPGSDAALGAGAGPTFSGLAGAVLCAVLCTRKTGENTMKITVILNNTVSSIW